MTVLGRSTFAVADLGAGLSRIGCISCGQICHAAGGTRAVEAVMAEHRCGGTAWHLGEDAADGHQIAQAPEG